MNASKLLAIDPGNTQSGWCVIDTTSRRPVAFGKTPNGSLRDNLHANILDTVDHVAIEMIAAYGMAVGADVFETCVWIGRYVELATTANLAPQLVKRQPVKLHHCGSVRATDANIRQALVDRFAPGQPNHGKGTTRLPGWFHGFRADIWQAYALAVYAADKLESDEL